MERGSNRRGGHVVAKRAQTPPPQNDLAVLRSGNAKRLQASSQKARSPTSARGPSQAQTIAPLIEAQASSSELVVARQPLRVIAAPRADRRLLHMQEEAYLVRSARVAPRRDPRAEVAESSASTSGDAEAALAPPNSVSQPTIVEAHQTDAVRRVKENSR